MYQNRGGGGGGACASAIPILISHNSRDKKFLHGSFLNSLTLPYFFFLDLRSELIGDNHCWLRLVHGIGIVVMATAYLPHEPHECDIVTN